MLNDQIPGVVIGRVFINASSACVPPVEAPIAITVFDVTFRCPTDRAELTDGGLDGDADFVSDNI